MTNVNVGLRFDDSIGVVITFSLAVFWGCSSDIGVMLPLKWRGEATEGNNNYGVVRFGLWAPGVSNNKLLVCWSVTCVCVLNEL